MVGGQRNQHIAFPTPIPALVLHSGTGCIHLQVKVLRWPFTATALCPCKLRLGNSTSFVSFLAHKAL